MSDVYKTEFKNLVSEYLVDVERLWPECNDNDRNFIKQQLNHLSDTVVLYVNKRRLNP